ncbi:SpoVR family protein [Alicyclobacillus curvatus]|nr:SpoVR family protein [Alicyclobacillus curvatus]
MGWRQRLPEIWRAAESLGLCPPETNFWEVSADRLYAIAASGLPGHYPHWTIGRNYEQQRTSHERGHGTIYEMVCNLEPCQAYLLDENSDEIQEFVASHVLGHTDLFRRNIYCERMRLDMDQVLHAATLRFREYEAEYGIDAVEQLLDIAHALKYHARFEEPAQPEYPVQAQADTYGDLFPGHPIDPSQMDRAYKERKREVSQGIGETDLLRFLTRHAPIEDWQRDVLSVVRETGLYFQQIARTKILHEGFASWTHKRILREISSAVIQDAVLNAGVVGNPGTSTPNPYWLGLHLLEHLERNGADVLELVRWESDSSLLSRIDETFINENEILRETLKGAKLDWRQLRDSLERFAAKLPAVEVQVSSVKTELLQLRTNVDVDETYAQPILNGMATLWRGQVELIQPKTLLRNKGVYAS